ncbi:hypothetical protein BDZ89DRAFT_1105716 [Hymenopellis radicata]|nr:hypothetical protein BDZ89DRAFT_1105716 [Hymenopellis radicata]
MLTAISYGVASVEADVWLVNGTLFVGHEIAALSEDRTLDALYIQPLLAILEAQNPATEFNTNRSIIHGVFDTASSTALQLFIDIKTDGEEAWQPVLEALDPLREKGYLTTFKDGELIGSAVTVIGTGNTPLDGVLGQETRDVFYDAPLVALKTDVGACIYNATISVVASTNYDTAVGWKGLGKIGDAQLANLTRFVGDAHECNLTARFWNTPDWPIYARSKVWKELLEAGADWLNADDLEAASEF